MSAKVDPNEWQIRRIQDGSLPAGNAKVYLATIRGGGAHADHARWRFKVEGRQRQRDNAFPRWRFGFVSAPERQPQVYMRDCDPCVTSNNSVRVAYGARTRDLQIHNLTL